MGFNSTRSPAHTAKVLLVAALLSFGSVAGVRTDRGAADHV
jgi:hypothetical protein